MLRFVQSNCANPIARSVLLAEFIDYEEPITHQQNSKMSEMVTATRYFCVSFSEYSTAAVVPSTKALCIRRGMKECTYFLLNHMSCTFITDLVQACCMHVYTVNKFRCSLYAFHLLTISSKVPEPTGCLAPLIPGTLQVRGYHKHSGTYIHTQTMVLLYTYTHSYPCIIIVLPVIW